MGVLRFFLALSVVFTHAGSFTGFFLGDGRLAVQAFYMISGFYMAMVWTEKYSKYDSPVMSFYLSRALRIYPMYFIVIALTLILALFIKLPPLEYLASSSDGLPLVIWAYVSQITLIGMETSVFFGASGYWISPVAWTLGLEIAFYLLAPFLVGRVKLSIVIVSISLASRAVTFYLMGWHHDTPEYALIWAYRFFPFEIALFLSGALSYHLFSRFSGLFKTLLSRPEFVFISAVTLVAWLCYFSLLYPILDEAAYWIYYFVVFCTLWVIFNGTKDSALDRYVGELSFPMYMVHIPLLWVVGLFVKPMNTIYVLIPLSMLLSMTLVVIQNVIDKYRHRIAKSRFN